MNQIYINPRAGEMSNIESTPWCIIQNNHIRKSSITFICKIEVVEKEDYQIVLRLNNEILRFYYHDFDEFGSDYSRILKELGISE